MKINRSSLLTKVGGNEVNVYISKEGLRDFGSLTISGKSWEVNISTNNIYEMETLARTIEVALAEVRNG